MLILTSCASRTASDGISVEVAHRAAILVACETYKPIYWSSKDTDDTIRAAKAHNAVGIEQCGWKP